VISVIRICGKCGAKISGDATREICPACLLEDGLGRLDAESLTGPVDSGRDDDVPVRDGRKAARSAKIPSDFGDYGLLEEVGRGGQGVVYRAYQKSLNRTVALKVVGLGPWATEAHLKRFRREAEAAASLEHPGIVPIHEVGERDGCCYFSMKFVEGGKLDEVAKREPMPIPRAVELIAKVARTAHYAHQHGILHRDIKPGNILLDTNGEPLLTDFGLARLVETESTVTRTKEVMGAPSYMAPEQAAGENTKLSKATDIYGLGAVLYQLLTGHPPLLEEQLRNNSVTAEYRAEATTPVKSKNRSRSFHNLPQVSGERPKAPLLFRSGAGGRSGTLAEARADPGEAKWVLQTLEEVGATETSYCCVDSIIGCIGRSHRLECLAKRTDHPSTREGNRSASVREPQPRSR
jgi:serine/threonine protein kinase